MVLCFVVIYKSLEPPDPTHPHLGQLTLINPFFFVFFLWEVFPYIDKVDNNSGDMMAINSLHGGGGDVGTCQGCIEHDVTKTCGLNRYYYAR